MAPGRGTSRGMGPSPRTCERSSDGPPWVRLILVDECSRPERQRRVRAGAAGLRRARGRSRGFVGPAAHQDHHRSTSGELQSMPAIVPSGCLAIHRATARKFWRLRIGPQPAGPRELLIVRIQVRSALLLLEFGFEGRACSSSYAPRGMSVMTPARPVFVLASRGKSASAWRQLLGHRRPGARAGSPRTRAIVRGESRGDSVFDARQLGVGTERR